MGGVAPQLAGTASGVFNTARQLGGALAIAIFGVLIAERERFVDGMRLSLVIAATLLLVTALATVRLRTHDGRTLANKEEQ